jgi:hypothetical protein
MLAKAYIVQYNRQQEDVNLSQTNFLAQSPPYAVEDAIVTLGRNLRIARVRRNMTIAKAASGIGAGVRAVRDAEHGKTTTAVSVYFALMWLYDLLPTAEVFADPTRDTEGMRLAGLRESHRPSQGRSIDNDF